MTRRGHSHEIMRAKTTGRHANTGCSGAIRTAMDGFWSISTFCQASQPVAELGECHVLQLGQLSSFDHGFDQAATNCLRSSGREMFTVATAHLYGKACHRSGVSREAVQAAALPLCRAGSGHATDQLLLFSRATSCCSTSCVCGWKKASTKSSSGSAAGSAQTAVRSARASWRVVSMACDGSASS